MKLINIVDINFTIILVILFAAIVTYSTNVEQKSTKDDWVSPN